MIRAELGGTAWPGGESSWGQHRVWIKPVAGASQIPSSASVLSEEAELLAPASVSVS